MATIAGIKEERKKLSRIDRIRLLNLNPELAQELRQTEEEERLKEEETAQEKAKNEPQKPEMDEDKVREVMRSEFANIAKEQTSKEETKDVGLMSKILNRFKKDGE